MALNKEVILKADAYLMGEKVKLRLLTPADCKEHYLAWLNDSRVNAYLETRWHQQSLVSITEFVQAMQADPNNYLLAIIALDTNQHIGNVKLGPINWHHLYADISYFIGDPAHWGKGLASDTIATVSRFGFEQLKLSRLQAGLYAGNIGSQKALEKAGYQFDACFKQQLLGPHGREDHLWFRKLNGES